MKKVSLIVHQTYLDKVIKKLHQASLMEIIDISKEDSEIFKDLEKSSMHPDAGLCANYELRLTRLIDILKGLKTKSGGIKSLLNPKVFEKKIVEDLSIEELFSYVEGTLIEIEKKILDGEKNILEFDEKIEQISNEINSLNYLKSYNIKISDIGISEYVIIKAGKTANLQFLENEVNKLDKATIFSKKLGTKKEIEWSVVLVAHISELEKIEKICREHLTEFELSKNNYTPFEALKSKKIEKNNIIKEKNQIKNKLVKFSNQQLDELLALREQIKLEKMRREIPKNFSKTDATFLIKGWILEKDEEKLDSLVKNVSDDHIISSFEKPSVNPDKPPTHIELPKWAGSFKTLLELFAIPKYNEINPSIIMGIFFILFFGIMLGDMGYGLIILFLSLFAYFKFKKFNTMIKDWAFLGFWIGLTTVFVGFLTNSFFGDLFSRFILNNPSQALYNLTLFGINFPVEPIRDPLTILMVALILGLIHLNTGIILAIYQCYKNNEIKNLFTKHFSWILLQIGGGGLIGDLLLHIWTLGSIVFYLFIIFVVIGIILLLLDAGPLGLFDVTGFIGDWLSYARLLALGLGTTGMALAFNVVAQIIPDMIPFIGFILVPIILVVTHIANLGIQALGAGVHSLRLQYVEFFNRFYEGGGKKFKPFAMKRKYTKIKEIE